MLKKGIKNKKKKRRSPEMEVGEKGFIV